MNTTVQQERTIFRKGSTTYYWSAKFFPVAIREDVFRLYSFVRVADDYVDAVPQQKTAFRDLRAAWEKAVADPDYKTKVTLRDSINTRVIRNMVYLHRKYGFDPAWTTAFLDSMQSDIDGKTYMTIDDTLWYIYGSAEVIGLMMARIMQLPPEASETARLQGRAMQFINFIRDIAEDNSLGRQYLPREDLERFGLTDLDEATAVARRAAFTKCIRFELARYRKWQSEAASGYVFIPRRLRIPIKTASDMYGWTATQIERDPLTVYIRKIKPSKRQVMRRAVGNIVR